MQAKNSLLQLEKDFIEPKDMELKDTVVKIKREIEVFLRQTNLIKLCNGEERN